MPKLKKVSCTNCSSVIYRSTSHINENLKFGHNFYCSKKCFSEYRTTKQLMVCENESCNKQFSRKPSGISPLYKRVETKARDGHICDSTSEAIIDDWLTKNGISHNKDVPYPQTNHRADWAIEKGKVFIEYFGLANDSPRYDRAVQKKIQFCQKYKIKLIEIYPSDLYPRACLDSKLKNEIGSL